MTDRGREMFERVVPAHLAKERRHLAPLCWYERSQPAHRLPSPASAPATS